MSRGSARGDGFSGEIPNELLRVGAGLTAHRFLNPFQDADGTELILLAGLFFREPCGGNGSRDDRDGVLSR